MHSDCPAPRVWKTRCDTCKPMCLNLKYPDACSEPDTCEDACECPDGYVEDYSGNCIYSQDCPCLDKDGTIHPNGHVFDIPDKCKRWFV